MEYFINDDRDYSEIIAKWVRQFVWTMDDDIADGEGEPGDDSGETPPGVKIIFDGYGYNEITDEQDDYNTLSFAVFIHKDSLTGEFPPHELTPWALIHRPKEECCIWVWYDMDNDRVDVIPFEDNNSTEMDPNVIVDIINKIENKMNEIEK